MIIKLDIKNENPILNILTRETVNENNEFHNKNCYAVTITSSADSA